MRIVDIMLLDIIQRIRALPTRPNEIVISDLEFEWLKQEAKRIADFDDGQPGWQLTLLGIPVVVQKEAA